MKCSTSITTLTYLSKYPTNYSKSLKMLEPQKSKLCRMMLTSRMILSPEQQKFVCEGDLASYMDYCPEWLKEKDDQSKNWMDLDNRMTETVSLCRAIGRKYFIMPDDPAQLDKCETIEKILVMLMNTMCYLINKICYAPNSPDGNDYDPQYARGRFMTKFAQKLPQLEELIFGPFIMGDSLPVYADFLLYACLFDINVFMPGAFEKAPKVANFMDKFRSYRSPIRRWFKSNDSKVGAYIRPAVPTITALLPDEYSTGDIH